jgi:hypothetical protein
LTVGALPAISVQPADQSTASGARITFSAAGTGTAQWQVSVDGGATYKNIPGATSRSLTFVTRAQYHGNLYRAVFTNSFGSTPSDAAALLIA